MALQLVVLVPRAWMGLTLPASLCHTRGAVPCGLLALPFLLLSRGCRCKPRRRRTIASSAMRLRRPLALRSHVLRRDFRCGTGARIPSLTMARPIRLRNLSSAALLICPSQPALRSFGSRPQHPPRLRHPSPSLLQLLPSTTHTPLHCPRRRHDTCRHVARPVGQRQARQGMPPRRRRQLPYLLVADGRHQGVQVGQGSTGSSSSSGSCSVHTGCRVTHLGAAGGG